MPLAYEASPSKERRRFFVCQQVKFLEREPGTKGRQAIQQSYTRCKRKIGEDNPVQYSEHLSGRIQSERKSLGPLSSCEEFPGLNGCFTKQFYAQSESELCEEGSLEQTDAVRFVTKVQIRRKQRSVPSWRCGKLQDKNNFNWERISKTKKGSFLPTCHIGYAPSDKKERVKSIAHKNGPTGLLPDEDDQICFSCRALNLDKKSYNNLEMFDKASKSQSGKGQFHCTTKTSPVIESEVKNEKAVCSQSSNPKTHVAKRHQVITCQAAFLPEITGQLSSKIVAKIEELIVLPPGNSETEKIRTDAEINALVRILSRKLVKDQILQKPKLYRPSASLATPTIGEISLFLVKESRERIWCSKW